MRHINEGDLVKLRFTDIQDIRAWEDLRGRTAKSIFDKIA